MGHRSGTVPLCIPLVGEGGQYGYGDGRPALMRIANTARQPPPVKRSFHINGVVDCGSPGDCPQGRNLEECPGNTPLPPPQLPQPVVTPAPASPGHHRTASGRARISASTGWPPAPRRPADDGKGPAAPLKQFNEGDCRDQRRRHQVRVHAHFWRRSAPARSWESHRHPRAHPCATVAHSSSSSSTGCALRSSRRSTQLGRSRLEPSRCTHRAASRSTVASPTGDHDRLVHGATGHTGHQRR